MARRYSGPEGGDVPCIAELEVNPFAFQDGFMVPLDGLCHLGDAAPAPPPRPIGKIDRLLHPRSIAVLGASAKGMNPGRVILRNLAECGFDQQRVTAVKEGIDELDGFRCVPTIGDLPRPTDLMVVAVAAGQVAELVDQIVCTRAAESVILIPGGMGETEGGRETEQRVRRRIAESHAAPDGGPVFVGGNCLGIQSRPGRYDTFFIPSSKLPKRWDSPGRPVAVVSQSGAYVITRMSNLETLDPKYAISLGNQTDLTVSDVLRALGETGQVDVYGVYVEGFQDWDGLAFARAVLELTAGGKDVVFYKAGRTPAGRSATAGHTASIAGDYNACAAAAANAGALVADTFKEFEYLLETAAHLHHRKIGGTRIGAISNAGYETVGMADAVDGPYHKVSLPQLKQRCAEQIRQILERHRLEALVNVRNPLDLTPMATEECHAACIRAMLSSDQIDAVVASFVPLTPALKTTPEEIAAGSSMVQRLPPIWADTDKPLVAVIDSGPLYDPLAHAIREAGVPVFRSADSAVRTLGRYLYHKTKTAAQ
jgi:acyl-CoA synthetase (NDP forming)